MVTFPYNTTDYAFALDPVFIQFESDNASYFTIETTLKVYDFYASEEKTIVLNSKIPLFNGKAKWNVGEKIQRNLADLVVEFVEGFQLKTTLVTFVVKELALADDSETEVITLTDLKFIPGFKPTVLTNNIGLLHSNAGLCRVTRTGEVKASFLLTTGDHVLKVYKNTTEISSQTITASTLNSMYTKSIDIAMLNLTPADVLKVEIDGTTIKKEFVIFPDTDHSNSLFFIDHYKLLTSLELTGDYVFNEEFNQLTHEYKRDLNRVLEIVETLEDNFITINTGFILKGQVLFINQFFKRKKAFLYNIEGFDLELVPISKKQVGYDSTEFLYSYELEFRINKRTYA